MVKEMRWLERPEGANQFPAAVSSKAVFVQSNGASNTLADGDADRLVTGAKCGECTDSVTRVCVQPDAIADSAPNAIAHLKVRAPRARGAWD